MSFKIPCGGFKLDENSFSLDENGVLSVTGGGYIPKPLTYDYMPEGYPKKVEFTGTLMEEQSVPNNYHPINPIVPIEGNTYTVNFEGTNYNCICHRCELMEEGGTKPEYIYLYIGNPVGLDIPGETSELNEPFLYYYEIIPSIDNHAVGVWFFYDEVESHTVAVQGTGIKTIPISPSFLPNAKENAPTSFYLKSSGSQQKLFEITVDDSGTLSATAVT